MVSSSALSSLYLEINPSTLIYVFSLAWMDLEDDLMEKYPKSKDQVCYPSIFLYL
jgi:hypothetical protein